MSINLQNLVGNKIKEIRKQNKISQTELSQLTKIERSTISKIENGSINITLDTLEKIINGLNISIQDLFNNEINFNIKPLVKWAGGKTQILDEIKRLMPKKFKNYYEPFLGGGALFFSLAPKNAFINEINEELYCLYKCFENEKDINLLISELNTHTKLHSEEYYYKLRDLDKDLSFKELPIYIKAARLVYLNKSCFNGLYRVNSKGYFNVPFGKKQEVNLYNVDNINSIKEYFENSNIEITNLDFQEAVLKAKKGDFVYLDPPYDTLPDKNGFVNYDKNGFNKDDQKRLSEVFKELNQRGVYVMLSNHNTDFINDLYKDYNIHIIKAKRIINSNSLGRGEIEEVIITNY
ncbi:adenine-specific DNA methyltransferase [Metamycoplasma cloacale]|uniref:Site-specific DNA-methyltransferase (adenine-specific) n=1 Tax=Metamycoplasma cloacale TaxID=92401 RepID=A0A2Z4LM57_9BACT|nr:Dam family site-specific DNA-(adenine-N6)-methyltransferase [Metamycoplasma cloacale]AWX42881.1 helix-turn-helix domain-containing protein [Metamycoplasma cloacale]VEU79295.1 adenine-specific DNA methyltransferase [Metamycoplasma cloacale]